MTVGLIQGFLRTEQCDPERGWTVWQATLAGDGCEAKKLYGGFSPVASRSIMASLTDQVTDHENDLVIIWLLSVAPKGSRLYFGLAVSRLPRSPIKSRMKPLALHVWQSDSGRELARQIAFRNLTYREYLNEPIYLVGMQLIQQRVLGTPASPEQRQLCLELMRDAHAFMSNERGLHDHIQSIGELVLLTPTFATWNVLHLELSKHQEIQATLAYLCGKRCQFLSRSDDAQAFFKVALEDVAPESLAATPAEVEVVE